MPEGRVAKLLKISPGGAIISPASIYSGEPEWRNRQTRYVQGVVGFTPVGVQIPPSAPGEHRKRRLPFFMPAMPAMPAHPAGRT